MRRLGGRGTLGLSGFKACDIPCKDFQKVQGKKIRLILNKVKIIKPLLMLMSEAALFLSLTVYGRFVIIRFSGERYSGFFCITMSGGILNV